MLDRTKLSLPSNWKGTLCKTIRLTEECGSTTAMRGLIENAESDVIGFGDAEILKEFEACKERAKVAFAYEETHG